MQSVPTVIMLKMKTKIATPPSKKKKNQWKLGLVMKRITRKKRERKRQKRKAVLG